MPAYPVSEYRFPTQCLPEVQSVADYTRLPQTVALFHASDVQCSWWKTWAMPSDRVEKLPDFVCWWATILPANYWF